MCGKFLLAQHQQGHRRGSPPVWSQHPVPEPECSSTPHTYTYIIMPMADVCYRYLHARRNWPPGSGWLLLKDDLSLMSSTQPEQCQQGCLTAEGDVFRAWHPQSPSLWQWPTICKWPSSLTSVYLGAYHMKPQVHITHNPMDLLKHVSSLSNTHSNEPSTAVLIPHLALLALWATPINTKLPISSRAVVPMPTQDNHPAKICNSDPSAPQVCEQINAGSESAKAQADKCSKTLAPLYAGQPVATYETLRKIWVPTTVICILPQNSYQVYTSNGSTYCHVQRHLCEHSVKAADTVPSGTAATLQSLMRHCFLAAQPASPPSAPCMQPTSAAPATLVTQMKQASAVPAMPAV